MPSLRALLFVFPTAALPFLAFACSSSSSSGATASTDASPGDATATSDAQSNSIVVPNDATITLTVVGGLPTGLTGDCTISDETYVFALTSGALTWKTCIEGDAGTTFYATGSKTVDASDSAPLRAILTSLQAVTPSTCPSNEDLPSLAIEIDSPEASSASYGASCSANEPTSDFTAHSELHKQLISLSGLTGLVHVNGGV